jgi:hypothetical protein
LTSGSIASGRDGAAGIRRRLLRRVLGDVRKPRMCNAYRIARRARLCAREGHPRAARPTPYLSPIPTQRKGMRMWDIFDAHCHVFEAADLEARWEFFTSLPITVVVDRMGRPDVSRPIDGPEFQRLIRLLAEHDNVWTKVSCPERLSRSGPPGYDDVVPFARHLVERFPDRVLWGTGWPHPDLTHHMPDDSELVDVIPHIAPTAVLQHELLVENPMRLSWGDPAPASP